MSDWLLLLISGICAGSAAANAVIASRAANRCHFYWQEIQGHTITGRIDAARAQFLLAFSVAITETLRGATATEETTEVPAPQSQT